MNRAGREPAEDVKRRTVAACGEAGLNEHLAAWAKTHPTDQPTLEKINSIMDEMKRQGFDGSMAIMQQIPPELRDAAQQQQHEDD